MPNDDDPDVGQYEDDHKTNLTPEQAYAYGLGPSPYNDALGYQDKLDYIGNINRLTNDPHGPDQSIAQTHAENMINADQAFHDSIQQDPNVDTQTPLSILIPKMASGTATKEEKLRFYAITGQGL